MKPLRSGSLLSVGRRVFARPLTRMLTLVLATGFLVTSGLGFPPDAASAHPAVAQDATNRLEALVLGNDGKIYGGWADNGAPFAGWNDVGLGPLLTASDNRDYFTAAPAAVSFAPGRLDVFAIPLSGINTALQTNTDQNGRWSGWHDVPGQDSAGPTFCSGIISSHCVEYHFVSAPAVTSWGPGRMEVFANAKNLDDGTIALLHSWADGGTWSGKWEVLGTGSMQGAPAAVSWGPGRTDVFVRGGGNELEHKWFDNGQWSSGWENLGGTLTSSPAVASWVPGQFVVFARDGAGGVSARGYWGSWFGWSVVDDSRVISGNVAVATTGQNSWDLFSVATGSPRLLHKSYNNSTWSPWQDTGFALASPFDVSAFFWDTVPFTSPTPPPTCGGRGQPACP